MATQAHTASVRTGTGKADRTEIRRTVQCGKRHRSSDNNVIAVITQAAR